MASRADVARLRAANTGISALVTRDLKAFWDTLNLARPEAARDALLEFVPSLVAQYGDVAATVSADWYDNLRVAAGVRGTFAAQLADGVPAEAVASSVRFSAGHLFTDAPTGTLDYLVGAAAKYALQSGRDTITRSSSRDPRKPSWARVPSGASTCAFCLVLASRGPVYGSKAAAGDMHKYHGHCDCIATPIWDGDPLPDGYDPDAMREKYMQARDESTITTLKGNDPDETSILQALRQQQGIR